MGSLKENTREGYFFFVLNNEEYYVRAHDLSKVVKQNANLLKQSTYYPVRKKKQKHPTEQDWKQIFKNWYKVENKNIRPALLARNYAKGPEADCYDAYLRYRRQHSRWKFAI